MKICIGGTFNVFHQGHKALIDAAFKAAGRNGSVFIGITIGIIASNKKNIDSFTKRKGAIVDYLRKEGWFNKAVIKPISDRYGPSIDEDFEAIVVSPETLKTAEEINLIRSQNGKKPLTIIEIPFVLADDGLPLSSTRIKTGKIDREGVIVTSD